VEKPRVVHVVVPHKETAEQRADGEVNGHKNNQSPQYRQNKSLHFLLLLESLEKKISVLIIHDFKGIVNFVVNSEV